MEASEDLKIALNNLSSCSTYLKQFARDIIMNDNINPEDRMHITILLSEIKRWNSILQQKNYICKENAQRARNNTDVVFLELQSLLCEIFYLDSEIQQCLSSSVTDQNVETIPLDTFMRDAPEEFKIGINDPNILRLNQLRFELFQRKSLLKDVKTCENNNLELTKNVFEMESTLNSIPEKLRTIIESTRPLTTILGKSHHIEWIDFNIINNLSKPLYTLYMNLCCHKNTHNDPIEISAVNTSQDNSMHQLKLTLQEKNFSFKMSFSHSDEFNLIFVQEEIDIFGMSLGEYSSNILNFLFTDRYDFDVLEVNEGGIAYVWAQILSGVWPNHELMRKYNISPCNIFKITVKEVMCSIKSRVESRISLFDQINNIEKGKLFNEQTNSDTKSPKARISDWTQESSIPDDRIFSNIFYHTANSQCDPRSFHSPFFGSFNYRFKLKHRSNSVYFDVFVVIPLCYPSIPSLFSIQINSCSIDNDKKMALSQDIERELNLEMWKGLSQNSSENYSLISQQIGKLMNLLLSLECIFNGNVPSQYHGKDRSFFNF